MPFTILDDYPPFPASLNVCCSCGAGRRTIDGRTERVVSLGFEVEIAAANGAATGRDVYAHMCETCTIEAGRLVGLVTPSEADAAHQRASVAEAEAEGLRAELADMRGVLDPLLARLQTTPDPQPDTFEEPAAGRAKKATAKRA